MVDRIMKKFLAALIIVILIPTVLLSQTSINNLVSLSVAQSWTALQTFTAGSTTTIGISTTYSQTPYLVNDVVPPTIASAATIAPVKSTTFVSGVASITTITAPTGIATTGGCVNLIPTGLWTTTTVGGNIALASTAVVNRVMTVCYDPTSVKWYPSY